MVLAMKAEPGGDAVAGRARDRMLGAVVFTYGMLMSFVLSGASRNRRLSQPNPRNLTYVGYVLCGLSAGLSVMLMASAMMGQVPPVLA
jgi:hypothetical protein